MGYSFFIFLNAIVDKVNWGADQFILGIYCGTAAVSVYSVASQLNQMFINLSTAISGTLLPKMSKMVAKDATSDELTNEMIKIGRIQYYIIFLMASGLVILGKKFINIWVGSTYAEAYYIALILIIPVCFPLIQNLGLSIIQAMNKYKFKAVCTTIMAGFNIIISVVLAQKYGAIGAAIGTAISLVVCNIFIMNIYYYKEIKLNVLKFWKDIFIMTIKFIPPLLVILIIIFFTKLSGVKAFLLYGVIYVAIFSINAYFFIMNEYEKNIVNSALYKLHLKK